MPGETPQAGPAGGGTGRRMGLASNFGFGAHPAAAQRAFENVSQLISPLGLNLSTASRCPEPPDSQPSVPPVSTPVSLLTLFSPLPLTHCTGDTQASFGLLQNTLLIPTPGPLH